MLLQLVLIAVLAAALLLDPSLAVAHDIGYPHADPAPVDTDKNGAPSSVIILLGVVMTVITVSLLVWLKNHDGGVGGETDAAGPAAE